MIAFSGVLSSCDMLARNSDLCWFAISSWRLLSSISRNRRAFSIAIQADRHRAAFEQLEAAPDDRVEHRLRIRDRAADHLEDLGSRSLLLQRFLQFLGALLDLALKAGV